MKTFHTIALLILFLPVWAQPTIVWQGGAAGFENEWNYSENWNLNRIPDHLDRVLIPNVQKGHLPVISACVEPVGALFIAEKAGLHIAPKGWLEIAGEEGVTNLGQLQIKGTLQVQQQHFSGKMERKRGKKRRHFYTTYSFTEILDGVANF